MTIKKIFQNLVLGYSFHVFRLKYFYEKILNKTNMLAIQILHFNRSSLFLHFLASPPLTPFLQFSTPSATFPFLTLFIPPLQQHCIPFFHLVVSLPFFLSLSPLTNIILYLFRALFSLSFPCTFGHFWKPISIHN